MSTKDGVREEKIFNSLVLSTISSDEQEVLSELNEYINEITNIKFTFLSVFIPLIVVSHTLVIDDLVTLLVQSK